MDQPLTRMIEQARRFAQEVIGLPIPVKPTQLDYDRKQWAMHALREELVEFRDATTIEDEADALIDLSYFALGRLVEMGLSPTALFDEVHAANMRKRRGKLSKRPGSLGHDAVKPEGWTPPTLAPYLVDRDTLIYASKLLAAGKGCHNCAEATCDTCAPSPSMLDFTSRPRETNLLAGLKFMVIGHARHGKDTVCEALRDEYGLRFQSSSMYCAENAVWPLLQNANASRAFLAGFTGDKREELSIELVRMRAKAYDTVLDCFEDRTQHRTLWYEAISAYNAEDQARLARGLYETSDVYCGLRSRREFHAIRNEGLVDLVIWVDAQDRMPPEPIESCTVEPWMADYVVDNNGSEEELRRNVRILMDCIIRVIRDEMEDE